MAIVTINKSMKISEVYFPLKIYLATVRVVLKNATTTARTTISADSSANAYLMLSRLYGVSNVISLSEVVNESPQTDQIHLDELFTPKNDNRQVPNRKNAQMRSSQVVQQRQQPQKKTVATRPIADPIKHAIVQDLLTKKFVRQSNIVKPTSDDIQITKTRAETALKRADLDFKKKADGLARKVERTKRRARIA
jgi:hypothetical protein